MGFRQKGRKKSHEITYKAVKNYVFHGMLRCSKWFELDARNRHQELMLMHRLKLRFKIRLSLLKAYNHH